MELRVTFPLSLGGIDVFHPSFFQNCISPSVNASTSQNISSKLKTDEYILLPFHKGSSYNVKMGDSGKTFDVKVKLNDDLYSEDWLGVAKGSLSASPGDLTLLGETLQQLLNSEVDPMKRVVLENVSGLLLNSSSSVKRVFTRKYLTTLKITVDSGATFVCEQIDFSIWEASVSTERKVFRSISLEGEIPELAKNELITATNNVYGDYLLPGGFPGMLSKALSINFPFQFTEKLQADS